MSKSLVTKIAAGLGTVTLAASGGVANAVPVTEAAAYSNGEAYAAVEYYNEFLDLTVGAEAAAAYEAAAELLAAYPNVAASAEAAAVAGAVVYWDYPAPELPDVNGAAHAVVDEATAGAYANIDGAEFQAHEAIPGVAYPASAAVAAAEENAYAATETAYNTVSSYVVTPQVQNVVDAHNDLANYAIASAAATSQDAIDAYYDASHGALDHAVAAANTAVADSGAATHNAVDFFIPAF